MATNFKTGFCKHCGAHLALHHADSLNCPLMGREAPAGERQQWMSTVYYDTGEAALIAAAPAMYEALMLASSQMDNYNELVQKNTEDEPHYYAEWEAALAEAEAALSAATPETEKP